MCVCVCVCVCVRGCKQGGHNIARTAGCGITSCKLQVTSYKCVGACMCMYVGVCVHVCVQACVCVSEVCVCSLCLFHGV